MTPELNRKIIDQLYINRRRRGATRFSDLVKILISGRPVLLENGILLSEKYSDSTFKIACCERNRRFDKFCEDISTTDIFIDIGANVGLMSLIGSYKAKCVYAIEPSPDMIYYIYKNIRLNERNNIFPIQVAISDCVEGVYLDAGRDSGIASISQKGSGVPVTSVPLDPFLLGLRGLHPEICRIFCKIDVEGLELNVLKGLKESINKRLLEGLFIEMGRERSIDDMGERNGHDQIYQMLGDSGYIFDYPAAHSGVYDQIFRRKV